MTWVYLDDHFDEHPKVLDVFEQDPQALVLFVAGLAYCARNASDGRIPSLKVPKLLGYRAKAQRALLNSGLWHKEGPGQAIEVHDWDQLEPNSGPALSIRPQCGTSALGKCEGNANAVRPVMRTARMRTRKKNASTPSPFPNCVHRLCGE